MKDNTSSAATIIGFSGLPVQLGPDRAMIARNVTVAGRRTSVRLEPEMWESLQEIIARESITLHQLCTEIARQRGLSSLTAAIRASLSPRFVPDAYILAPAIPRTLSGKKQELPVKRLFQGWPVDKVINPDAIANPEVIPWYLARAKAWMDRSREIA